MKAKTIKLISIILAMTFLYQQMGWGQSHERYSLRPRAASDFRLNPLQKMLRVTNTSLYRALFQLLVFAFKQGDLEGVFQEEWTFGTRVAEDPADYFADAGDRELVESFLIFRDRKYQLLQPKSKLSKDPNSPVDLIHEVLNLYVLHSTDWESSRKARPTVKILLVEPSVDPTASDTRNMPIALTTLAACAQDSSYQATLFARLGVLPDNFEDFLCIPFEFRLLDLNAEKPEFDFAGYLKKVKPDIVGIRVISLVRKELPALAGIARETLGEDVKIICGGVHVSALPEETLSENPGIVDVVFKGESEETFPHYLLGLYAKGVDISSVPGLYYPGTDGVPVKTPPRELVMDLNDYPSHVGYVDLLNNPGGYKETTETCIHGTIRSKAAILVSSRGCTGNCTFCAIRAVWLTRAFRAETEEKVLKDMDELYRKGYRIFYIRDDNFTNDHARVRKICDEIIAREWKIAWCCMSRVAGLTRELLIKMRDSGLAGIAMGAESGDENVLRGMRKYIRIYHVRNAGKLCRDLGINHRFYFMVGYPGENWYSILKSMVLITDAMIGLKNIDTALPGIPGTIGNNYAHMFERICWRFVTGDLDLHTFLEQNLVFPEVITGIANISCVMPYPGSELYSAMGSDISMLSDVFQEEPVRPEEHLGDFPSPTATKEMNQRELTEARVLMVRLVEALKNRDLEEAEVVLREAISRAAMVDEEKRRHPDVPYIFVGKASASGELSRLRSETIASQI